MLELFSSSVFVSCVFSSSWVVSEVSPTFFAYSLLIYPVYSPYFTSYQSPSSDISSHSSPIEINATISDSVDGSSLKLSVSVVTSTVSAFAILVKRKVNIVMLNRIQNPNLIYPGQCLKISR